MIDVDAWCKSLPDEEHKCPIGYVDILWCKSLMGLQLKRFIDRFCGQLELLAIQFVLRMSQSFQSNSFSATDVIRRRLVYVRRKRLIDDRQAALNYIIAFIDN